MLRSKLSAASIDVLRLLRLFVVLGGFAIPAIAGLLLGHPPSAQQLGQRMRHAFERMGLTYVKLGQFLAMRFDLFPEAFCAELAQLFDDVAPMPAEQARRVLEQALGAAPETIFERFDTEPMAAASVAQVHRARTRAGEDIAIKLQRYGIARIFAADMRNLVRLAHVIDRLGVIGAQSAVEAVCEFERFTAQELDFHKEGETAERLRARAGPHEYAPRILWEYTSERVLAMELIRGHRLSDVIAGRAVGLSEDELDSAARNLARACLRQLFETGFFHADPHPGNIFILEKGTICFIDFGIFGELPRSRREALAGYIEDVATGSFASAYRRFQTILTPSPATDYRGLRQDIGRIFRSWHAALSDTSAPTHERYLGKYVGDFMEAVRRNHVGMSIDTLLFWRTLITLDATAMQFRQSFDLLEVIREFFREMRPNPLLAGLADATRPAAVLDALDWCAGLPDAAGALLADPATPALIDEADARDRRQTNRDTVLLVLAALGLASVMLFVTGAGLVSTAPLLLAGLGLLLARPRMRWAR